MQTSEVLTKAADLIQTQGWRTGIGGWPGADEHDGRLCLEGGIMAALGLSAADSGVLPELETCPAYQAVCVHVDIDHNGGRLYDWNDRSDRTAAEVVEVLRAAALIEAAKENAETRTAVSA